MQIEAAFWAGRISDPDRQLRVVQAEAARTLADLDPLVRDLLSVDEAPPMPSTPAVSTYPPGGGTRTDSATPFANRDGIGVTTNLRAVRRTITIVAVVAALVLVVIAAVIAVGVLGTVRDTSISGQQQIGTGSVPRPKAKPRLLTEKGFDKFRADLRDQFKTTKVAHAVFRSDYAFLDVPLPGKRPLQESVTFDGSFGKPLNQRVRPSPDDPLIDLAAVDSGMLVRLVDSAPKDLDVKKADPEKTYVIFDVSSGKPTISVYAGDKYESGYTRYTMTGRVVMRYPIRG